VYLFKIIPTIIGIIYCVSSFLYFSLSCSNNELDTDAVKTNFESFTRKVRVDEGKDDKFEQLVKKFEQPSKEEMAR